MKLQHYDQEKLKKEILEVVGHQLDLNKHKVFFFGSRVNGRGDERSDIDVGIEGKERLPAGVMLEIQEGLEQLPTLYKIEAVDFRRVSDRFSQVARQQIEPLN